MAVDRESLARLRQSLPPALAQQLATSSELLSRRPEPRERFPIGFRTLDALLGGGLRRGGFVEMVGRGSSGRFSLGLSALASATQMGEPAALVDLGDHLDPRAAEAQGIELPRLLWLRPGSWKQALAGAEAIVGAGFPLIVLDAGLDKRAGAIGGSAGAAPPDPARVPRSSAWLRLGRAAKAQGCALLLLSSAPMSGTAADTVLHLRAAPLWHSWHSWQSWHLSHPTASVSLLDGLSTVVTLLRQRRERIAAPGITATLRLSPHALRHEGASRRENRDAAPPARLPVPARLERTA